MDSRFRAKVADFGISAKHVDGGWGGTPYFLAPEVLSRKSTNTPASDMYSFGIILYEVYSRKDPYEGEIYSEVIKDICDPAVNKRPPIPADMPYDIEHIMQECIKADPASRPSAEELDGRLRRISGDTQIIPGSSPPSKLNLKELRRSLTTTTDRFPRYVAEALREGRKVKPQHKECVTIFFAEIADLNTSITEKIGKAKVTNLSDRLFAALDNLTRKFDIFRVETVGNS